MTDRNIVPEKITKPIQLLAAWLAGLVVVNGSFLGAAASMDGSSVLRTILVVASIVNVPLFLFCLFLLQTKFRPEMQEDSYYAKYLESNTGKITVVNSVDAIQELRISVLESNQGISAMLSGLSVELKAISGSVANAAASDNNDSDSTRATQILEVADRADATAKAVERALHRSSDSVSVSVNDLLPNFQLIRSELLANQIGIDETFGSTSETPEVPLKKILSFGRGVPVDFLRKVVKICLPLGIDRIHFASAAFNANTVYIGSYNYRALDLPQSVALDSKLMSLIDSPTVELNQIIDAVEDSRPPIPRPRTRTRV